MKILFKLLIFNLLLITYACERKVDFHPENERIWLHRANTIQKAQRYQYQYGGLEIDVFFNDSLKTFVIKHNEDDIPELTLKKWCDSLDNISQIGVWFDFKNLNADNCDKALRNLKKIRRKYHMKGKLIVESSSHTELQKFKKAGFLVSFYIPCFNPWEGVDSVSYRCFKETIQDAIDDGVSAISGYDYQYHFMKKEFPGQTKLIWTESVDSSYQARVINTLTSDTLVDVILLPLQEKP